MVKKAPRGFPLLQSFDPGVSSAGSATACPAALTTGSMALAAAMPQRIAVTHPNASEFSPAKLPSSSSRKTASRLYRLDLLTLFSEHHSPIAMPDARRRSTGQAPLSPLEASRNHPSPGPDRKGPGPPWCDNASRGYASRTRRRTPGAPDGDQ